MNEGEEKGWGRIKGMGRDKKRRLGQIGGRKERRMVKEGLRQGIRRMSKYLG